MNSINLTRELKSIVGNVFVCNGAVIMLIMIGIKVLLGYYDHNGGLNDMVN